MLKEIGTRTWSSFVASHSTRSRSLPSTPTCVPGLTISIDELLRLRDQAAGFGFSSPRQARSIQAGGHLSPYRGRGMEFEEVRAYQPGDDIRHMDWRVTARTGRPHTKLFREERERPVLFLVDLGPSMAFGVRVALKSVVAARAAALLAWAARDNGDRMGGVVSAGERHRELRPAARERGLLPFFRALVELQPDALTPIATPADARNGHWTAALQRLTGIVRPGSLVFLLSDFRGASNPAVAQAFARLAAHSEVVVILVYDPLEAEAPPPGRYPVCDGQCFTVLDTSAPGVAEAYRQRFASRRDAVRMLCHRHGGHFLMLATDQPTPESLRHGLAIHHRRPGALARRA
ncbi:MAG: DUF58 domain-containing protein [Gammaproteobacteria bacterium]|nr:DUF58 domain-containing protein [Gammaproteobacteria bacterium]